MTMLSLILLFSFKAHSADVQLGELSFGESYSIPPLSTGYGFFDAPKTGDFTMLFEGSYAQGLFSNEACSEQIYGTFSNNFGASGYTYRIEEGKRYYVKLNNGSTRSDMVFRLYMDGISVQPFNMTYYAPQTTGQTTYDLTTYNEMFVRYSKNVASNYTVEMTYTSNGGNEITNTLSPAHTYLLLDYVYIRMGEVLTELLNNDGATGISSGAPFTVRVQARDNLGQFAEEADAEGWLSFNYLCGYIPTEVVSSKFPEEFLSYWPKGSPDGQISVTYNGPLRVSPAPTVTLMMGNPEEVETGGFYTSTLPARVEGNTVYADLTGVRRTYDDIMNGNTEYTNMTIRIGGLYDIYGQPVKANLSGNRASYVANLPFKNLEKTPVISDWVPAAGSKLANYNSIEVWIKGLENITFDGFTVESTTGNTTETVLISMAEVTVSEESPDGSEAVYTFTTPAAAKTAEAVKIYPTNLQSLNGYDYNVYLTALFNTFTFTAVNPSQGASLETLEGQKVEAIFNYNAEYPDKYVTFYVKDLNADSKDEETLLPEVPMSKDNSGVYYVDVTRKSRMYINHTYEGVFTAWANESDFNAGRQPIGTAVVTWYGSTPAYVNGTAILEEITPAEGTPLSETNGVFVVTFDSQVRIDESRSFFVPTMTEPQPFESVTPLGDDIAVSPDGYDFSIQWELKVPEEYINASYPDLTISFVVIDADEKVVLGNVGRGEDSCFEFSYYNGSGVETLNEADFKGYEVYTLTGIRILKTDDVNAVRSLSPGIYIVNGKKVKI